MSILTPGVLASCFWYGLPRDRLWAPLRAAEICGLGKPAAMDRRDPGGPGVGLSKSHEGCNRAPSLSEQGLTQVRDRC